MNLSARTFAACLLTMSFGAARAQDSTRSTPVTPPLVHSNGQQLRWQPYAAGLASWSGTRDAASADLTVGLHHPITNPVTGLLGAAAEGYGVLRGPYEGGGVRLLARSPLLALATGVDWNLGRGRTGRVDWMLSYQTAVRRGGLLGHGTMLRVDWLPTRRHTLRVGVHLPLLQPLAGRTRPRDTEVGYPRPPSDRAATLPDDAPLSDTAERALATVARDARLLGAYSSLQSGTSEALVLESGEPFASTQGAYIASLSAAFGAAAGDPRLGAAIAQRARRGLFDDLIVPYDSLFGQPKERPGDIRRLAEAAAVRFARWVDDSSSVPAVARPAVLTVHRRWLDVVARVQRDLLGARRDSRSVWLPLTLALAPGEYDDQAEVDSVMARLVGRPFTDDNALGYLRSVDLPLEIARTIYAARDYHVLWMHDFAGQRPSGSVDEIGYQMVADAYFPALTAAVQRYDSTGQLPVYMILIDQFFYESTNGRLWMTMLEDPLAADVSLPGDLPEREAHLRERQRELRDVVARSARLQREADVSGGERWLRRMVKVHVTVNHPADFSFRSHHIIPPLPFIPDNVMRDHRKIVLYDVDEAQPYRGAVLLMGVGVGEHYASDTWEDRGYRLRGPAALETRAALRRALRANAFSADEIPLPLREVRPTESVERAANDKDYVGRALQVHNDVGFGRKESSIARAVLYDLVAPGSTVVAPDPLWLSETWAGMLAGAAARGARVQIIAPAAANAPSPQAPLMATAHDLFARLIDLRDALGPTLRRSGGELRIGIFAAQAQVNDYAGRRREVREGLRRAPWIRELVPFDAQTLAVLDRAEEQATTGADATDVAHDEKPRPPQLHQKTQLIARPGAIAVLARQPGWDVVLSRAMSAQSRQTARFADQIEWTTPAADESAVRSTDAMLVGYEQSVPEAERERVSFYFSVGTQNEDPRGLASDGEASLITSGFQGVTGLVDLYFLMARSTWIADRTELERYLPAPSRLMRLIARLGRPTF